MLPDIPLEPLPPSQPTPSLLPAALVGGVIGGTSVLTLFHFAWPVLLPLFRATSIWITFPLVVFVVLSTIFAHELGHVVGGLLVRFKFTFIVIGPIKIETHDGRLRLALNRQLALAGGVALCLPPDDKNLENRYAAFVVAGPIASFLMGILSLALFTLLLRAFPDPATLAYLKIAALTFGFVSTLLGLVTLIPMPNGQAASDGLRLVRFLRGGDVARRDIATLALVAASLLGKRPRHFNPKDVRTALIPPDGSLS